jgi:hypothetical protein
MDYLHENPGIYLAFRALANDWQRRNPGARFGAKMLVETLRYQTTVSENGGAFKLNNSHTALLARLYLAEFPRAPLETRESHLDNLTSGLWGNLRSLIEAHS